ncbi:MAG: hypothetical protein ACFFCS_30010 [Candidatus Hodarchaeota archaeon]
MSKAKRQKRLTDRLQLTKSQKDLSKLLDMIALVSLLGILAAGGGGYLLDMLYTTTIFSILMFCIISFGLSYAVSHMMREHPHLQVKYFKMWFTALIATSVILILRLGMFY